MKKKAEELLMSNLVFIVLNVVFFVMLIAFVYLQSSNVHLIEQKTAKQIVLLIDAAEKGTLIQLDVEEVLDKAKKNKIDEPIKIDNVNNLIIVKLDEKSYYKYSFFNDIDIIWKVNKENNVLEMRIE